MSLQTSPRRQGSRGALVFCFVILLFAAFMIVLLSNSKTGRSGIERNTIPNAANAEPKELPAVKGTPTGKIFIGVIDARLQGNLQHPGSLYCAIAMSVSNGVDRKIQNLVLGVDYSAPSNDKADGPDKASGNVSFRDLDADTLAVKQHHIAMMADCQGLTGKVTVVSCIIDPGIDCRERVRIVKQGIVRLQQ